MPSGKRTLQIAVNRNHEVLKPEPPADLWEQLHEALEEVAALVPARPPGSFTRIELQQQFGLTEAAARRRLAKLMGVGKIKITKAGARSYYVMVK